MANPIVDVSPVFSKNETRKDSTYLLNSLCAKSYGTILFGHNQSNRADFIRVPSDASPFHVQQLLHQRSQNKRPSLIISVIGSSREYNMKSKLFRIFRQGLLKVAKTTNIWIITNGINSSINKLMGDIVRTNPDPSRPIRLIGISPWGCIAGSEQLDVHGRNVIYRRSKSEERNEVPLESNHTDFLFVDDGTKHQYGSEIEFRSRFEKSFLGELSTLNKDENDVAGVTSQIEDMSLSSCSQINKFHDPIPVVLLIIDGGFETIIKVHESVMINKVPVVLLEGTGGCCDLFAKCYYLYNEYSTKSKMSNEQNLNPTKENIKLKIYEKLNPLITELNRYSSKSYENINYFHLIYECIEKQMIFINFIDFKIHSHIKHDVDLAILQALLNVKHPRETNVEQKLEQLNLALEWNRVDIVKSLIMTDECDWIKLNLNDLFVKALIRNQTDFIQLFLDHDFCLNDLFKTSNKLLTLYQNQMYTHIKHNYNDPLRSIYKDIIQPYIGTFFEVDAIFNSCESTEDKEISDSATEMLPDHKNFTSGAEINFNLNELDINRELYLWSLLTGKQELALLFWARGKNKICAALIGMLILKNKARKEKDIQYNEWANQFENLAVEILEKFYRTHPNECTKAIIRQIRQFGNVTWLHLAVVAEAKLFIAQKSVQNVLSSIWFGHIHHCEGNMKIIFSSIMIWYSGFLMYHDELFDINHWNYFDQKSRHRSNLVRHNVSNIKFINNTSVNENNAGSVFSLAPGQKNKSFLKQYLNNISNFLDAPYVKYLYNLYSHVIFLVLFSYVILCDFFPLYNFQSDKCLLGTEENLNKETRNATESSNYGIYPRPRPSASELILIFWMITILMEEIRQILSMEFQTIWAKLIGYISIFWNQLDVFCVILFFIGIILRFYPSSDCFCGARIILAIDLSLWYIRTLDLFSAVKQLGPKLVMIGEMVHDLIFFMLMLTVFILAFGVPAYSLMYGVEEFSWHLPRTLLSIAYWQIFENYEISGYVVFFLLISYMTIASVLLINLLIAMFSNTFDRLQADADCIWKFQHYSLVCYHLTRPCLPPPFVFISHIWHITIYLCSHCTNLNWFKLKYQRDKNREKLKIVTDEKLTRYIEAIEDAIGNEVYYLFCKIERKYQTDFEDERTYSSQDVILNRMKIFENRMRKMQNQQDDMFEYLQYLMDGIKKIGGDDIETPKQAYHNSDLFCKFYTKFIIY